MAKKTHSQKKKKQGEIERLQETIKEIKEKVWGVNGFGEAPKVNVDAIPTGSISLDLALGVEESKGRIVEIFGPESSVKQPLLCILFRSAKARGIAAFVDAEHALDPEYARKSA